MEYLFTVAYGQYGGLSAMKWGDVQINLNLVLKSFKYRSKVGNNESTERRNEYAVL